MEPIRTTIDDCAINSKYNNIIHSTRILSVPLLTCDDQLFNGIIKQENIDNQVLHGIIKQKFIDNQVFNEMVKKEIIDKTDHHLDSQLLQKRIKTEEKRSTIDTKIKVETDFIDSYESKRTSLNKRNSSEYITSINLNLTSKCLKKNPLTDNCDKMSTVSNLTVNARLHTGEMPYKCHICNQAFSQKLTLTMHTSIHTGEMPYECNLCNKAFSQKITLTMHRKIHTGVKPYKCDTCNKAFSQKIALTLHTRTHTGIKPYKCNFYDKEFSTASDLTKHTSIHTGEMSYKCNTCNKAFSQKSNLTRHTRNIHMNSNSYLLNSI